MIIQWSDQDHGAYNEGGVELQRDPHPHARRHLLLRRTRHMAVLNH